jgi:cell wall-associated NlpC family hydrolase
MARRPRMLRKILHRPDRRHASMPALLRAAACALLGLLMAVSVAPGAAASPLSTKKAQLGEVQAKLETVYREADVAVERYDQANAQMQAVDARIEENRRQLAIAAKRLRLAREQLVARAQGMYKTREVGVLDVVLAASDFDELVAELDLLQRLGQSDADLVKNVLAYRDDVRDRRAQLEVDRRAAARLVAARAKRRAQVVGLQARLEDMTAGLKGEIERLQDQAAARAEAAAQAAAAAAVSSGSASGSGATVVDPGGSGHSAVVAIAQRYLGVPYLWGGASPAGFDCSGLAMYCYAQIGISLPRVATAQQQASTPVPLSALQPGDLVFFGNASFSHHVGIYVGGGAMIDAPHHDAAVRYDSIAGAWIGGRP